MNEFIAISIAALSLVALLLGVLVLARFRADHRPPHAYWGAGILLVAVTLAEEVALYVGAWSQFLIRSYLVLVAILVGLLSLGSAELSLKGRWRTVWFGFIGLACAACTVIGGVSSVPSSIMYQGVVWRLPPTDVVVASTLVTVPSALLLIVSSVYGAIRQKRPRLLYIAIGTAVISLAGTLYIVSFPVTLYYAEFVGVVLLFLGFVNVGGRPASHPTPAAS